MPKIFDQQENKKQIIYKESRKHPVTPFCVRTYNVGNYSFC